MRSTAIISRPLFFIQCISLCSNGLIALSLTHALKGSDRARYLPNFIATTPDLTATGRRPVPLMRGIDRWSFLAQRPISSINSRLCLLDQLFKHQFSDLVFDGDRRGKLELPSKPMGVHLGCSWWLWLVILEARSARLSLFIRPIFTKFEAYLKPMSSRSSTSELDLKPLPQGPPLPSCDGMFSVQVTLDVLGIG